MRWAALFLSPFFLVACSRKEVSMVPDASAPKPPVAAPQPPAPPAPKAGADIRRVLLPSAQKPLVNIRLLFLAGSVDDPKGKEGLTALTAAVMAKGGTTALTSAELLTRLYPMAADLDVQAEKEMTVFIGKVHRDHLEGFLPILEDVLLRPRWDAKEFERLRSDAINDIEKRLRTSDDENLGKAALEWLMFEGHPYQHFSGGTVQGLKAITLDDLKAHAQRVFTRARLVLGLAGAVDGTLADRLQQALAALPAGSAAQPPAFSPGSQQKTRVLIIEKECSSTAISLGHPYGLRRSSPEFAAAFLGNSAFGEHRQLGGRLFNELREKRGLNYGDYSYLEHFVQDGHGTYPLANVARREQFYSLWVRPVEHANRLFALRAALYQLDRLLREGLSAEEVDKSRSFLMGYTRMWEQTDMRRLGFALDDRFYDMPPFLEGMRRGMSGVKPEDVSSALRKHIDPAALRIAIVTKGAEALRAEILSGKPSPIHYATPKDKGVLEEDRKIEAFPLGLKPDQVRVVKSGELFEK
jgi:zinc protease